MLGHYIRAALRFLRQNKLFTGINIFGLSLSLAVSFIILLYVINEISYDHSHKNRKRVFRIVNYYRDFKNTQTGTPYVLSRTLKAEFPQVEKAINARRVRDFKLKHQQENIDISNGIATQSELFDIFTIPLTGTVGKENLLEDLSDIVLSRRLAELFFPGEDAIGREIEGLIDDTVRFFVVSAVFEDIPDNSSFTADCFVNGRWTLGDINRTFNITDADANWTMNFWNTWILLSAGSDAELLEEQFRDFEVKHISEDPPYNYSIQKLRDVYLRSTDIANSWPQGNIKNIRLFSLIAFLIVLIASINYIILSTAVSTGRAKEIGIRKCAGAGSSLIRYQLLSESIFLALVVLPVALLLLRLGMPSAERLFQTDLQIIRTNLAVYIMVYLVLTVLIGIASGIYASSYLSRMKVVNVLKNAIHFGKRRRFFRSFLIVVQLVIFCSFVSSTLVIRSQYQYALSRDPGHLVKDVLLVELGRNFSGYIAFMEGTRSNPNVIMAAGVMRGLPMRSSMSMMIPHFQDEEVQINVEGLAVDYHFLETVGIPLLEGRYFSEVYGSDLTQSAILNETAVRELGITDPVGNQIAGKDIVGIVKDFNLHSLHSDIPPLMITMTDRYIQQVAVHYKPGTLNAVITALESEWEKAGAETPFRYSSIEDIIESIYSGEKSLSTILSIAAIFALLIAALGLFGLTLFVARTRTREIGIRKVFGSSERSIVYSFVKSNLILVIIAELLSIPVSIYLMTRWLNNFAYRTTIGWWVFLVAFIIAAVVVLLTVFFHSVKASRVNPVDVLRYE